MKSSTHVCNQLFMMRNMQLMMMTPLRSFASPTKKIGLNDNLKESKKDAKKYGIKRRFYDHLPTIARQLPVGQYRTGLTEKDLEGYND